MMNREELERLIVDASDGVLNEAEITELENQLQDYPDLYEDYQAIMKLPDMGQLYVGGLNDLQYQSSIQSIKQSIRDISIKADSFEIVTLDWFKRYALAASIAIFAITSVFSLIQSQDVETDSEIVAEEYFYPADESTTDSYVLYFEGVTNQ